MREATLGTDGLNHAEKSVYSDMRHIPTSLYIDTQIFVQNEMSGQYKSVYPVAGYFCKRWNPSADSGNDGAGVASQIQRTS